MVRATLPQASRARSSPRVVPRAARFPRGAVAPVVVEMRRGTIVESRHRGHIVQVASDGRIERACGDAELMVSLRSALKPFSLMPLIESGAADAFSLSDPELALMAGSHSGEDLHVRTLQGVFRRAGISQTVLLCGAEGMPLDPLTASRLARDGETPGAVRHMCSGAHAASILLSRHRGWPIETYCEPDHPSQEAIRNAIGRVFGFAPDDLQPEPDACGLSTYAFPLVDLARAYALLADPLSGVPLGKAGLVAPLTRIRDAMLAAPELIGGTRARLDTELMRSRPGLLVAKGGAEGLQCAALLPGARGEGSGSAGLVIKIDDGDGFHRALPAATVESLAQLHAIPDGELQRLAEFHRPSMRDAFGRLAGQAIPDFELAPLSELV